MMRFMICFLAVWSCCIHACAQVPSLKNNTLNFRDITDTNVNQTVLENQNLNEKLMDFADYDNDGDLDCVMAIRRTEFGQRNNKLYRNDGGILNEVSGGPIIPGFALDDNAKAAFFRDFDLDGFADIIIVCNSNSGANGNDAPGRTKCFRNVNGVEFVNETERLDGITGSAADGVSADFDNNGLADLVMVNEPNQSQNKIVLNGSGGGAPGQFKEVFQTHLPSDNTYGDNGEAADMNGDGLLDLLIGNSGACYIYYNHNQGMGSGPGDFRYDFAGSETVICV